MSAEDVIRRLRRPREGRVLAGAASGLARYLGVDAVVVRVGFVALAFAAGLGLGLYLLVWATVPAEGSDESFAEALLRRVAAAPAWVRVLLGGLVLLVLLAGLTEGSGILSGLVLIVIGVLLLRRNTADAVPASTGATAMSSWPAPEAPAATGWAPPVTTQPKARAPSILGRLTLSAILLTLGMIAALELLEVLQLTAEHRLALVLTLVGAGLVVGARWGRARWLIALGVAILPLLAVANLLGHTAAGGIGERIVRPQTLADVRDEYRLTAGALRLDLTGVDFPETPTSVAVSVGVGELVVVVPREARVEVDAAVRLGELDLPREDTDGNDLRRTVVLQGMEGGGRLRLDVDVGVGAVSVRRGSLP